MRIDLSGEPVLSASGNSGLDAATVSDFGAAGARFAIDHVVAPAAAEARVTESNITNIADFMHGG